jgi:hypothetical protein
MKTQRFENSTKKISTTADPTIWLAGLTLLIFGYILFQFVYPMVTRGLLF